MVVADFVKICSEMMKLLAKYDIRTSDYKYTQLFSEYLRMEKEGLKVSYIVALLAHEYRISEASVYRILRRFKKSVKP